ncbi:MAG: lipopolysaccharide heptosyltransferase II [Candidatus Cloacimonetes bacterium]|nr:lipopolysaccharide heptosyltransferase II [Candidatus Cloacimonadota bacterium]
MKEYKRILIAHTAFLGDIILATPLIRETRKLFPKAKIDFLTTPRTYELVKNNPHLDEVILFDKYHQKLYNFLKMVPRLISKKYDLAITPHSHLTTNFLLLFSNIPERIGFDRYHSRVLLTTKVKYPSEGHVTDRILHLLSPICSDKLDNRTELFLTKADYEAAENFLEKDKKPVLIAPGSVWATKRWKKEYFGILTRYLAEAGFSLIFIGSRADRFLATQIIEISGVNAYNSCGELKITESAALISRSKLLISNDSGPLHLANAVNTPVYAFFGPTVESFGYYPNRENDQVLEMELACRPCGMHGSRQCPLQHHNCMELIKPEAVFETIRQNFQP